MLQHNSHNLPLYQPFLHAHILLLSFQISKPGHITLIHPKHWSLVGVSKLDFSIEVLGEDATHSCSYV